MGALIVGTPGTLDDRPLSWCAFLCCNVFDDGAGREAGDGMPLGRSIARFNRIGLNRLTRHIAPWMPGFGLVTHHGRVSGKVFHTPVNVFRRNDHYVFALTYGRDSDWVKNVLAAGGCELETRRRTIRLARPRIERDEHRADLPAFVRAVLHLTKVYDFLVLDDRPSITD